MILDCAGVQEINGQLLEWTAQCEVSYRPAQLFGRPENSYPDESECDILALETWPPGFEGQVDEDAVREAAWKEFAKAQDAGEA